MPGVTPAAPFEYPAFYEAAGTAAASGQRLYMRSIRIRLIALVVSAIGGAITWKVAMRAGEYAARRDAYVTDRIEDQRSWYAGKARRADRLNTTFLLMTIVLEFVGITAAAVRAAGFIDFDLLGTLAALTGGFAAWAQTRQWGSGTCVRDRRERVGHDQRAGDRGRRGRVAAVRRRGGGSDLARAHAVAVVAGCAGPPGSGPSAAGARTAMTARRAQSGRCMTWSPT
jgi:hypothetical protein